MPDNQGERRECLIILEKVDWKDGLLKCLMTDAEVSLRHVRCSCQPLGRAELQGHCRPFPLWFIILMFVRVFSDWHHR